MTSSWEGKSRWPGVVLGKIKSLWSTSHGTASDGLNQLIDSTALPNKVNDDGLNQLAFKKGRHIRFIVFGIVFFIFFLISVFTITIYVWIFIFILIMCIIKTACGSIVY